MQLIYQQNFLIIPLLLVATLWYVILTTLLSIGQYYLERHYARGTRRDSGPAEGFGSSPGATCRSSAVPAATWRGWHERAHWDERSTAARRPRRRRAAGADPRAAQELRRAPGARRRRPGRTPGEVAVLLGPSGSGKSTLLRCVNHLETPDAGFVEVGGELIGYRHDRTAGFTSCGTGQVTRQRARVGMVFQQFNLFPHMTVLENIVEAPVAAGAPRKQAAATARELLERVGLGGREGFTRGSSPAASSNASPSPGRSPCSPG